ncbi:MAG: phosphoglycerate kinase, partial [Nanoarchaeota archaeon]|nr:phosphoglycerate kinase [Nanoarchaeota archaeon]
NKIKNSERIKEHVKTIKELLKKKASVVILAHQGSPGKKDYLPSMKQHAQLLKKYFKVEYVDDVIGARAVKAIKELKPGNVLLLSNVRNLKEEFAPSKSKIEWKTNKLVKTLFPLFDIYVNDAFSVSHRNQTSIVSFPKVLPSCAGRVMEKEISGMKNAHLGKKPITYILAGFKPDDNIKLMKYALKNNKVNKILTAGLLGHLFVIAKGYKLGAQEKYLKDNKVYSALPKIKSLLKKYPRKIIIPVDLAVDANKKRKEIKVKNFPSEYEVFDLGKETIKKYLDILKKSNTIYLKGPTGWYHEKRFGTSTKQILKFMEKTKSYTLIGGGHTNDAIDKYKLNKKKMNHISLSGGASISYLAGEKLPGIEALKKCTM